MLKAITRPYLSHFFERIKRTKFKARHTIRHTNAAALNIASMCRSICSDDAINIATSNRTSSKRFVKKQAMHPILLLLVNFSKEKLKIGTMDFFVFGIDNQQGIVFIQKVKHGYAQIKLR